VVSNSDHKPPVLQLVNIANLLEAVLPKNTVVTAILFMCLLTCHSSVADCVLDAVTAGVISSQ
jgi:hypothetical protein